ncbi:MAG TPA: hypothetical protein VG123_42130 [Streptosporangiaceae bacterium]|nr:hypothetical protein [Streptosporangiaceae bacterium]
MRGASTARRHPPVRLSQRDIDGLLLCGEHYGAPLDLLAEALGVSQVRMNAVATRWRRAGYVDATAAYVALRSAWARSEAYADVTAAADDTSPLPVTPAAAGSLADPIGPAVGPREVFDAYTWQLPGRIRYGRPLRLVIRGTVAALLCLGVLAVIPGDPATPPLVAVLITWLVVTGGPTWPRRGTGERPRRRAGATRSPARLMSNSEGAPFSTRLRALRKLGAGWAGMDWWMPPLSRG